ncbi:MAG: SHD1 domain-containing protein [Pirellulaceae bacterium]
MSRAGAFRLILALSVHLSVCHLGVSQGVNDASPPRADETRVWRDATGKFEVSAQLIGQADGVVKLKKADGKVIEVPASKLSPADQEYLQRRAAEVLAANPFAGGAPESQVAAAPAPVMKSPAPSSVVRGDLKVSSTPLELFRGELPQGLSDPDATIGKMRPGGFAVEATDAYDQLSTPVVLDYVSGKVALSIGRHVINKPQEARGRIFVGTLPQGPVNMVFEIPEGIILLDHHRGSDRSAMVSGFDGLGRGGELVILEGLGSSKPREIYRRVLPGIDTPGFKPKIEWARILDSEHIAVVVNDRLSVWEITSGEVAYSVDKISSQQLPSLSPGGRLLAIPNGSGVTVINALDGQSLGHIPSDGPVAPSVSFHPDGKRLALCSDNRLVVFDLQSGQPEQEVTLAGLVAGAPLGWVGEHLLLSQDGSLIDTEMGMVVWHYTIGGNRNGVGLSGALLVFTGSPKGVLASLPVPHAAANQSITRLQKAGDKVFLVCPGSTVALDAQVAPGVDRKEVLEALRTAVERTGWKVADRAPTVVVAKVGRGAPQQLSFTSGMGVQVNPDPKNVTQATLTPFTADLEIKRGDSVVWTRKTENRVPPLLFLREGESIQQAVSKFERPDASFFENVNIPPRIPLADVSQSIGLSSLEGIQWRDPFRDSGNRARKR